MKRFSQSDPLKESYKMPKNLIPASHFTVQELTNAYNQTRVDYLVPMPMNAARLQAYIDVYDVDLEQSVVAMEDEVVLGLGMLGVRENRSWITRLGVLPVRRRQGTGTRIMQYLLKKSDEMGLENAILEVIEGNNPGHELFSKSGFQETRVLLILRRAPGTAEGKLEGIPAWYETNEALVRFSQKISTGQAWTNEIESLRNAGDVMVLKVEMKDGESGWMIFRRQELLLSHFTFYTERGDPIRVAKALLGHLYRNFPGLDTYTENIALGDPHLPALLQMNFFEVFRRIEMHRSRPHP